jgi:phenylalanyl-tRNA synthetase alpha chain
MKDKLTQLKSQATAELAGVETEDQLNEVRTKYLGRKGLLTGILRSLSNLPVDQRPLVGRLANQIKLELADELSCKLKRLRTEQKRKLSAEKLDVTLPGRRPRLGRRHPITQVIDEVCGIFMNLGFQIAEGPEVEWDYYNFEALNIPADHPARDMHDTFYITDKILLRTHTSPVQIRVMEKIKPPVRIIAPGKAYRCDADLTHTPMFHQVEGLLVDEATTFGELKGVLSIFVQRMFGEQTKLRFRPSFFPFTEPSAEVDIACVICEGTGCRVCSGSGWLEILGAGMVDPAVFAKVGYDAEKYTGFAFGMGIERIAMLKYGIDDIRLFFENDVRFLAQF